MLVYLYDENFIFTQTYFCQPDPLEEGEWIVPTLATVVPVPELAEGDTALYHEDTAEWEVVPAPPPPEIPFDLPSAQAAKKQDILQWRADARVQPVVADINGVSYEWQADQNSQDLISGILAGITIGYADVPPFWRSLNNTNVIVSLDDLKRIATAMTTQVATAMYHSFTLADRVAVATTQADLDAITWESV